MINVVTATYPFLELLPGRNLVIFFTNQSYLRLSFMQFLHIFSIQRLTFSHFQCIVFSYLK